MKNSLVTVVIPTYKRPETLARALNSVLIQSYPEIEIIVVDDNGRGTATQLETQKVIESIKGNITYLIHEVNKGGSAARNTGWRESKGSYITFLDDDDEISDRKIELQVECLENLDNTWGACYTKYNVLKPNGKILQSAYHKTGEVGIHALMRTLFMGSGSNLFLRKSVVDEVNGYDESFVRNQDIEFMTRVFEKYKLAFVDETSLIIHLDDTRSGRGYKFLNEVSEKYLRTFMSKIDNLGKVDRRRVIDVITLERARTALYHKRGKEIFRLLTQNHVRITSIMKYIFYLCHRAISNKSYGFYLSK